MERGDEGAVPNLALFSKEHVIARSGTLVAIPCLNEELAIAGIVLRARRHAEEVVVIDDGSTDKTAEAARLAGATVLSNERNRGKGYSVRRAFRYAEEQGHSALVLMDGDGQHDPDEIPLLLEPVIGRNGQSVDMALGFRFGATTEMPLWRRMGKRALDYLTAAASGTEVTDSQMGFRAFGPRAIRELSRRFTSDGFSVESETLLHAKDAGLRWENVHVSCRYEGIDGSTKGPVAHAAGVVANLVELVTARRPLLFLGLPSILLMLAGVGLGIYTLQFYNRWHVFPVAFALGSATLVIVGTFGALSALILNLVASFESRLRKLDRGR